MRLIELESSAVAEDLQGALKRAAADLPEAEQKFKSCEIALAKATTARLHAQKMFGKFNAQIALLWDKQKAAKLRALTSSAMELDDVRAWKEYETTKTERERIIAVFEYLSLYVEPDATRALMVAELAEREAYADMMESRVALQRLGLATEMAKIADLDPGVKLAFSSETPEGVSEGSWSHGVMTQVKEIRGKFPEMRSRILQHDKTTQSQRELATNLFN